MAVDQMSDYLTDFDASRVNVGQGERWMSLAAGAALAAWGARRRDLPGGLAAATGAALLYRGATGHCPINERIGRNTAHRGTAAVADYGSDTRQRLGGPRGVHVDDSVTINRPVAEVYRFWRNFENLPRFMNHLESVAMRENGITHWVAKGPAGVPVAWDARIVNEVENKLIGWQSLEGSTVATAGSVHFEPAGAGTRLRVHFQYDPPGGKLGASVARLFGEEPNVQVRDDLRRLKEILEGNTPVGAAQSSMRDRV